MIGLIANQAPARITAPERRIMLLAAAVAPLREAAAPEIRNLAIEVDWPRLTAVLRLRGLLPSLGPRIVELAAGRASNAFSLAVDQTVSAVRRQSLLLQLVTQRAIEALAEAGVRSRALKGPLLGEAVYGDPGRRVSNDIDLLVAPNELGRAVAVIRDMGYTHPSDYIGPDGLPQLHFALVHEHAKLPPIELHWRIHWYEQRFAVERLLAPSLESQPSWRPRPADELAALLQFYARDGFMDLRMATDVSAWWDTFGSEVPREALDEVIRAYHELSSVIPVAAKVAEATVGVPGTALLTHTRRLNLRQRIAVRLANPHPEARDAQIYAEMSLIDGLLTPRGGMQAFVRRQLLMPSEVLEAHDRQAGKSKLRSAFGRRVRTLIRLGVLGRYGLALTRLVRPRRWHERRPAKEIAASGG